MALINSKVRSCTRERVAREGPMCTHAGSPPSRGDAVIRAHRSEGEVPVGPRRGYAEVIRNEIRAVRVCRTGRDASMRTEQNYGIRAHELIRRLIAEGSDRIAFHVYRRVAADRVYAGNSLSTDTPSWPEIAEWARREGLLDLEQARLLRNASPLTPGEATRPVGMRRRVSARP
jgi:hypothetical protein